MINTYVLKFAKAEEKAERCSAEAKQSEESKEEQTGDQNTNNTREISTPTRKRATIGAQLPARKRQ